MTVQGPSSNSGNLPPTEIILTQSIAKAQQCQDIFRYILDNKNITRIEILDYILAESESLTLLSQSLLMAIQQAEAALLAEKNKIIADAHKASQATEQQPVTDTDKPAA